MAVSNVLIDTFLLDLVREYKGSSISSNLVVDAMSSIIASFFSMSLCELDSFLTL